MVEGVGVSDEQLDEWEEDTLASVRAFGSARNYERLLAVIGEVRASRARQSEAVSALAEFTNDAVEDEWECPECGATTRARMADKAATPPAEPCEWFRSTPESEAMLTDERAHVAATEAAAPARCQGFTIRERPDHQPLGPCIHCGKIYQQH